MGMSEDRARHIVERDRIVRAIEGQYDEYRRVQDPGPNAWTRLVDEAREVLIPREG
jgi:hypothetical protein